MAGAQSKALKMVIAAALGSALGACAAANPINWVRDLTGASKNDDLDSGRNKENSKPPATSPIPPLAACRRHRRRR